MLTWVWLSTAAACAVTACNSNGGTTTPAPSVCATPGGMRAALVYPAPNATGVPRNFGQVVIGSTTAFPSSWDVALVSSISPAGAFGGRFAAAPTPLPTPNAPPAFAHPVYQSSSFAGAIFPGVVVQVFLNDAATNCVPTGPLAQFTTQ